METITKYMGPERRKRPNGNSLKTWHFITGLIIAFIAIATFWRSEMNDFMTYAYPRERGIFMEKTLDEINHTLHETNGILTDLRIALGGQYVKRN